MVSMVMTEKNAPQNRCAFTSLLYSVSRRSKSLETLKFEQKKHMNITNFLKTKSTFVLLYLVKPMHKTETNPRTYENKYASCVGQQRSLSKEKVVYQARDIKVRTQRLYLYLNPMWVWFYLLCHSKHNMKFSG